MSNNFYLYLVLAIAFSLFIASFQYFYKNKDKSSTKTILFVLRFLSIFLLLLLWINPKIIKNKIEIIKPSLVVLADNSKSISSLKQEINISNIVDEIKNNKELNDKFTLDYYTFSGDISLTDTLDFKKNTTNIFKTLQSTDKIYKKSIAPIIIITDGNQTLGNDYTYSKLNQSVYPLIVGDTTVYQDIYISQLNVNKYAYLKNKFPVELFVNYNGLEPISSKLTVTDGRKTVYSKIVQLDFKNSSEKIDFFINTNSIGFQNYRVKLSSIKNEKNILNNRKDFTIEVLNEQSKVLIVSDISHPDIAMLKRAIESNKQRKVTIANPKKNIDISQYQMVIIYQPTLNFEHIFAELEKTNKNTFIITGTNTNWNFLNTSQKYFNKKAINNMEDYLATYNSTYNTFLIKNIGFENFQPLTDAFGKVNFSVPYQSLLFQQIGNINSSEPLLATFEQNGRRGAVLFGENSWRWRMTSKIESNSFEPFDDFINKIIQYLASNKKTNYLDVSSKHNYYQNEKITITAKFYDANYVFNPSVKLNIKITNKQDKKQLIHPFALTNNNYEVNVSNLTNGSYSFVVYDELNKNTSYGNFTILDYNIEQQFTNANKKALEKLAKNTNGIVTYPNSINNLIKNLNKNEKYVSIQKSKETTISLIDWQWVLGIIILLLSAEWFIRKYKGYI